MKRSILLLSFLLSGCFLAYVDRPPTFKTPLDFKPVHESEWENWSKVDGKCNSNPFSGGVSNGRDALCYEKNGWYLEGGPACESDFLWDDRNCVMWRKKHSKPDAKPWVTGWFTDPKYN